MFDQVLSLLARVPPLVYIVVGLGSVLYLKTRKRYPKNIPPIAEKPYPIFGHLPLFAKTDPVTKFTEWRQKVGDIFSFYSGQDLTVVINSYPLLKEAFVKNADYLSDRPYTYMSQYMSRGDMVLGIASSSGPNWKEQRSVSLSILRSFGMGKNFLAEKINEEIHAYLQELSNFKGEPTDIKLLTNTSVSNVICSLLIGQRFEYDDPFFRKLMILVNEQLQLIGYAAILTSFPILKYLPGDRFGAKRILKNGANVKSLFGERFIKETNEDGMENLISAYYDEMNKRRKSGDHTYLDEDNLLGVVSNLFVAGTETTSSTIMWAILFAVHYPEVQKKVYKEIFDVIGTERPPTVHDKPKLNYMNAYILETQRLGCIAPFSLPHVSNEDVEIAGYIIPKGTVVTANLSAVLKDPEIWDNAHEFKPERFLNDENNLNVPEEFIPFSLGRRFCMGESLAKMEMFLFFTGIFQRFEIKAEDPDNLPTLVPAFGATSAPQNFKIRLIERA